MAQNLIARALPNQLGAQPDRYINGILSEGVWDLSGDHFEVVEQAAPGMSVRAGSGAAGDMAVVEGAAALSGRYIVQNQDAYVGSGNTDLSIGNGDPSDPRIDLVVLRVYDDEMDSSGSTKAEVEVVAGTPASSPVAPDVPDGAIALASILVPANESTSIENADITDLRGQSAAAGPLTQAHGALVNYRNASQSIADNTFEAIVFDATQLGTVGEFWSRLSGVFTATADAAGLWKVEAAAGLVSNSTGRRDFRIRLNGAIRSLNRKNPASGVSTYVQASAPVLRIAEGDTIDVQVFQNSGGALDLSTGVDETWVSFTYLGA